jgi:signal transduction histidine kinase
MVADVAAPTNLRLTVDIDASVSGMVDGCAVEILQIAREALSNVVRHAQASQCLLRLHSKNGCVVLEVADDGVGIPTSFDLGHGLRNIRTRAAASGARVEVRPNHPKGTIVQLTVPIQ